MDTLNDYDDDDSSNETSCSGHNDTANSTPPPTTSQRLNHIQTQQQPWIQQLQAQPEFHNPHFFEAVVEHFGIDSLGTNLPIATLKPINPSINENESSQWILKTMHNFLFLILFHNLDDFFLNAWTRRRMFRHIRIVIWDDIPRPNCRHDLF